MYDIVNDDLLAETMLVGHDIVFLIFYW